MSSPSINARKPSLLTSSAGGASLLIALQIASRALTFIVNQILLRYLSPELFGISTQLEVYSISILFFSRESLRVAIQRQADTSDTPGDGNQAAEKDDEVPKDHVSGLTAAGRTQALVNLAYIPIYAGMVFTLILALLYTSTLRAGDPGILATPYFERSLQLYGFAAFWELLSEPCFVVVQQKSRFAIRARAEAAATLVRCLGTCGFAIWAARVEKDVGVLPFAVGQMGYALTLMVVYLGNVWDISSVGGFYLVPTSIYSKKEGEYLWSCFYRPLLALGGSLFAQSIVKHILTQGDTILISWLASPKVQGVYALANNYGGLIARLLLQPIEESSRNYFGKLLSSTSGPPSEERILQARTSFLSLIKAYVLLSVAIIAAGPTIAPLLLKIIAGRRWTDSGAGDVLAKYCYYIPLLAINGLTEAFVSSVATEAEVNRQSVWMLTFSAGFGGAAYFFLRILNMGAEGLVWANALNMAFRILWSSTFIAAYMRRNGASLGCNGLLPKATTIAAAVGTFAVLSQLDKTFTGGIADFIKSGAVAGVFVIVL
ncbi:Rft protein-domain-containing protein [Calycina marina]|uniref:Man(5)GlcNAc(2)-PP-dolichol translocation protein RFT1 n=1 Tax=Calycina marina TaxID=1763456 RepID=A0A9P8CIL3_9HELO|nr:Rft protein-domain-containing protein [Calycina marina]